MFFRRMEATQRALAVAVGFTGIHVLATWAHIGTFWGDSGRWLHEIDRFANGETAYLDFSWQFPPLALWVFGTIAKWFGSNVEVIWTATSGLTFLIFISYVFYCRKLVEPSHLVLATTAGTVLGAGSAMVGGAAIPTGMYSPAVPLGVLLLLLAALAAIRVLESNGIWDSLQVGILCGAALLTKQDFWLPAIYLVAVSYFLLRRRGKAGQNPAFLMGLSFAFVVLAGWGIVLQTAGWKNLIAMMHGFGSIAESAGRGLPSWERIVLQSTCVGLFGVAGLLCVVAGGTIPFRRTRTAFWICVALLVVGGTTFLGVTYSLGRDPLRPVGTDTQAAVAALVTFGNQVTATSWPLAVPFLAMLLLLSRWRTLGDHVRRNTAVFLLGLCCVTRLRRLFEYTEWYSLLLELPVYLFLLGLVWPKGADRRGIRYLLLLVLGIGGVVYWLHGEGRLTKPDPFIAVETPKGKIKLRRGEAERFLELKATIDAIDPAGHRPLLAYGYTGGFNYFLGRTNPSPLTQGFFLSTANPEAVYRKVKEHSPPVILLNNRYYEMVKIPSGRLRLDIWGMDLKFGPYEHTDRPYFDKLLAGCEIRSGFADKYLEIFDCKTVPGEGISEQKMKKVVP